MGLALQGEMGALRCAKVMEVGEPMKPQAESPWGWEGAGDTDAWEPGHVRGGGASGV